MEKKMKEKFRSVLGGSGIILYYIVSLFICFFPFFMISVSFWVELLIFLVLQFIPAASVFLWIWGLIAAINGTQDVFAYIYYILFAAMFLPFFIGLLSDIFGRANK